jgi:DNA-binding CsgD family transcriptional regulator
VTTLVPERRKGNLPAEVTSFIGRRRELSQVRDALERYRLVTLRGVGGIGKTRLALHLAADLQRSFADGVWLAELSALRNAELLARTVAASLGLPDEAAGDPVDLLADYLAERHLLLILDTCEHLVDGSAKLAEALLPAAPRLRILATSREPLGVRGEQAQLISPLGVPDSDEAAAGSDSVALFADRAEAMVPGFTLTVANQQPVIQLCRRLDGIPLALELAAVRLRAMSVEQIVARLDDRFLLLGTARSSDDRHQTLRAAIGWSHELCGAGDAFWKMLHAPIQQGPYYAEIRRSAAETCRQALGDERFESYRQRGLELSVAEAIAVARNEVPVPADEISAAPLTRREREIAELVTQGLGNREIAEQLVLAKRTVDSHIEHIFSKLAFTSRTQLAAWVSRQNAD